MGYHIAKIEKGVYGEFSKIKEEFQELEDAVNQGNKVLIICELTDLIGAIAGHAKFYNLSLQDLIDFSDLTQSAFKDGTRETTTSKINNWIIIDNNHPPR
jgi:hypothetical protein